MPIDFSLISYEFKKSASSVKKKPKQPMALSVFADRYLES